MGMWALEPWDNDEAADWYDDLMEETRLRDAWLKGIGADPTESPGVVRAAGAVFVMLGRVYVWPIDHFDQDLEQAIAALSEVAKCDEYQGMPELQGLISSEIAELKARRKPDAAQPESGQAPPSKPWWRFW
jgi:hypothetical protein